MLLSDLVKQLRNVIGDNNLDEPNITDAELTTIITNAALGYSRIKGIVKSFEVAYDKTEEYYDMPDDSYRAKTVLLKELNYNLKFRDNLIQIILEELPDVDSGTLKITYSRYFQPDEIDDRELDIFFLYAEALCFKLMASKTAELIKFSTGEKIIDESLISDKYFKLYKEAEKNFRKKAVKAYGKRVNNILENLDYNLPYPTLGETP